jgi:ribonuclease E
MSPTEAIHTPLAHLAAPAASAATTPEQLAPEVAAAISAAAAAAAAQPDMASQEAALQLQALADAHPAQPQAAPAAVPAPGAQEDAMEGVIVAEPELPSQHGVQGLNAAEPEELEVQHVAAGLEPPRPTDETLRISAPAALQEPAPAAVSPASAEEILDLSEVSVEEYGELYHGENIEDDAMWISIEQERANAVAVVEDEQAPGEEQQVEMEDAQTEGEAQQLGEEDAQTQGEKRQSEDDLHSEDERSEASHQQRRQTKRVKLEGSTDGSEAPRSRQRLLRQLAE